MVVESILRQFATGQVGLLHCSAITFPGRGL